MGKVSPWFGERESGDGGGGHIDLSLPRASFYETVKSFLLYMRLISESDIIGFVEEVR